MFILSLNSGKNVQRYLCLVLRNKTLKLKIFFALGPIRVLNTLNVFLSLKNLNNIMHFIKFIYLF